MDGSFRKSMGWLHTWAGVVVGSLLFAIFWMGSLSVFDREIDRWMMPATRLEAPTVPISLDALLPAVQQIAPGASQWGFTLPNARQPTVRFSYQNAEKVFVTRHLDATTGAALPDQGTLAGTGFIFPFHFKLHLKWMDIGYWLVGLAGMAMLVLVVSGVVIHRKIFTDFFLFRPKKRLQRASLDLHNLTGVLGLPFHFLIALSGLVIFIGIYFPTAPLGAYAGSGDAKKTYREEAYGRFSRDRANAPAALASLDAMSARAAQEWRGGQPYFVRVHHPGDANAYVEVRRSYAKNITMNLDQVFFDGTTGQVLSRFEAAPVMTVQRFISGLHFIQFEHWALRWLYFVLGLSGCVMIATGFVFWLEARRASHAKKGLAGVRLVEALTIGSVSGIVAATGVFFIANRLLPLDAEWLGVPRKHLEMWAFYLAWLASFAHAGWRPQRAWREQTAAIAVLAVSAVVLNALTTADALPLALARGQWAVAGMDLLLLAAAGIACLVLRRLAARQSVRSLQAPARAMRVETGHG